jgi:hypothetical protein
MHYIGVHCLVLYLEYDELGKDMGG